MESSMFSLAVIPAAFFLGLFGAVSSCCNIAVLGAIAGFSGVISEDSKKRNVLFGGLCFMFGTIVALAVLGAVTGFVSQVAGAALGVYWKFFAGLIMVLFGLAVLDFLPFNLPKLGIAGRTMPRKLSGAGAMIYGFAIGGTTTACSVGCNPALLVALGTVTLQGHTLWGAAILATFAVGYSLPFTGALIGLGLGFGKLTSRTQKITPIINTVAGGVLIAVGFYLLATI